MPASWAATAIWVATSRSMALCSMSMNSQSKPAVFMALPMSTVRACRTPTPMASSPASSRFLAAFWIVIMG